MQTAGPRVHPCLKMWSKSVSLNASLVDKTCWIVLDGAFLVNKMRWRMQECLSLQWIKCCHIFSLSCQQLLSVFFLERRSSNLPYLLCLLFFLPPPYHLPFLLSPSHFFPFFLFSLLIFTSYTSFQGSTLQSALFQSVNSYMFILYMGVSKKSKGCVYSLQEILQTSGIKAHTRP